MNIKQNKPNPRSQFKQGYFRIDECLKYRGKTPVIYRSSWEKMFCEYCERNPDIKWWSSESVEIRYYNPITKKHHTYYPDFLLRMADGSTIIVEIKPSFQLIRPDPPKRRTDQSVKRFMRTMKDYATNMAKAKAAKELAAQRGYKYLLVTEDFFKPTNR